MKLKSLINEAVKLDDAFGEKMRYWVLIRQKTPELQWLMEHLERILGVERVKRAAEEEIQANTITP
jgi:hypothetical protein